MKRRLLVGGLVLIALASGAIWWRPDIALGYAAGVSPEFAVRVMLNWREKVATSKAEESKRNLETGAVRVDLGGQRFDVPMRYLYSEGYIKRGYWPAPKEGRVQVGALSLTVLLPELRPYHPEDDARWQVRGHGDRVEVSIAKETSLAWFSWVFQQRSHSKHLVRQPDTLDLVHLHEPSTGDSYYFPVKPPLELAISCDATASPNGKSLPSPSCHVKSNYCPGIVLDYYFGLTHLPRWREIDEGLKSMFNHMADAAQSENSSAKE